MELPVELAGNGFYGQFIGLSQLEILNKLPVARLARSC